MHAVNDPVLGACASAARCLGGASCGPQLQAAWPSQTAFTQRRLRLLSTNQGMQPPSKHPPGAPLPIQALSSPLSGLLADRLDRTHVVAFGCFLWGVMTAGIGMATTLHQAWP